MTYYVIELPKVSIREGWEPCGRVVGVHESEDKARTDAKIRNIEKPYTAGVEYKSISAEFAARNYRLTA